MATDFEGFGHSPGLCGAPGFLDTLEGGQHFHFSCHPGVRCFTDCCRDLNLRLTPYDVIRVRKALGLDSSEFLERYTVADTDPDWRVPGIRLRMDQNEARTCPFVQRQGCGIYADRPGACRAYPLARAARRSGGPTNKGMIEEKYFLVRESHCRGFGEAGAWTARTWMEDQGLHPYNEMNDLWMGFLSRYRPGSRTGVTSKQWQMFVLACYSPDRFRAFVFGTRFLSLFSLSEERVRAVRESDEALLRLALDWLALALCGDAVLRPRPGSVDDPRP